MFRTALIYLTTFLIITSPVIAAVPKNSPTGERVTNATTTSLTIFWNPVTDATYYSVSVEKRTGSGFTRVYDSRKVTQTNTTYTNLIPNTEYRISIQSCNNDGCKSASTDLIASTKSTDLQKPPEAQSPVVNNQTSTTSNQNSPSTSNLFADFKDVLNNNVFSKPLNERGFTNLGGVITNFMDLIFALVGFLAFMMLIYGALRYIFAGGDKQGLQAARQRMTYAIVGLIVVALAFAAAQFIEQVLTPSKPSPINPTSWITTAYAQSATPIPTKKTSLGGIYDFGGYQNLGDFISKVLPTVFSIAAVGVVFFFLFGAFKWLASGGNKEGIASGRSMITHAVIGFFLLMMIFLVMQYLPQALGINLNIF